MNLTEKALELIELRNRLNLAIAALLEPLTEQDLDSYNDLRKRDGLPPIRAAAERSRWRADHQ